ncbi:glycogen-binding domain-containing protein [uncultured Victivallis sp.]|uniref:glycogen-binding domain-containing protein n=1 Tax=uncultured Victivallis sp. TaxID=354118 RepID=UPI0025CDF5FF|nr:glycogen-binding domain-containing protein [uncultured Victivallis sp.]
MTKSNRPARRRVTFLLEDEPGKVVAVAGSFNEWLPDKQLVDKNGDGIYTGMMMLEPGVYEYKFVVNGEWRLDDRNPNFKPNDVGSLNSVLVVEEK